MWADKKKASKQTPQPVQETTQQTNSKSTPTNALDNQQKPAHTLRTGHGSGVLGGIQQRDGIGQAGRTQGLVRGDLLVRGPDRATTRRHPESKMLSPKGIQCRRLTTHGTTEAAQPLILEAPHGLAAQTPHRYFKSLDHQRGPELLALLIGAQKQSCKLLLVNGHRVCVVSKRC